ncbi:putative cyclase [Gautieria morchelliformis]|nr:putative cyclase [Gautieria morchelliformis]
MDAALDPESRLIDLSYHVDESTQLYPGDPKFSSCPALTLEKDGFNVMSMSLGTHTGTHVDAPSHSIKDGASITALDLSLFQGPALVIDVRRKQPREQIIWEDLKPYESQMQKGKIVVLYTGWSMYWKTPKYIDHPFLDRTAAEGLVKAGIRTVAMDSMSPDETVHEGMASTGNFIAHKVILSEGGVIAENLTNVEAIADGDFTVSFMPLKLTDADGSPVRAVAWRTGQNS